MQPWVSVNSVKDSIMVQMRSEIQTAQHGLSSLVHPADEKAVLRDDTSLLDDAYSTSQEIPRSDWASFSG